MIYPNVFVIIVTYNGMRWYDSCFNSLRQSSIPVQTIVVDNASNDGTSEYIKEHFPEIYLIDSHENIGFGRANNLAMRYALDNRCDYVFLLNQDTWVEPDSIENLINLHKQFPFYGVLSPMHIRADGKSLYIQIEDGSKDHGNKLLGDCYFGQLEDIYPFTYVNAAAWLIPKETLEIVGGFDPIFPLYGEDDDYINRLRFHGLQLGLCPKIKIIHDHQSVPNPLSSGILRDYYTTIVGLIDPNKDNTLRQYMFHLFTKGIKCCLHGKFKQVSQLKHEYDFLAKKRADIERSRRINSIKQPSWL